MLSDFEIIIRHFPENNDIKIYPISDVHLGAAEHLAAEWDNFCKRIYDKLACLWRICSQINDDAIEFCSAGNHLKRQPKGNEGDYVMAICKEIDFARMVGMEVIYLAERFSGL